MYNVWQILNLHNLIFCLRSLLTGYTCSKSADAKVSFVKNSLASFLARDIH